MQGFPDYFTFVGHGGDKASSWVRNDSVTHRYQQLGNAVCPLVAEALGRCLALAAAGKAPSDAFVVSVPNEEYDEVWLPLMKYWHLHSHAAECRSAFISASEIVEYLVWALIEPESLPQPIISVPDRLR